MSSGRTGRACLVLIVALFGVARATGESAPEDTMFVRASNIVLTEDRRAPVRFETVLRAAVDAHRRLETGRHWRAYQQELGRARRYTLTRVFDSFKAMDEPPLDAVVKVFGQAEADRLYGGEPFVESSERGVWVRRLDLSVPPDDGPSDEPGALAHWLQVTIRPSEDERYVGYLTELARATREVDPQIRYTTFAPLFGSPDIYVIVAPTSYEAMDAGLVMQAAERLRRAFGPERAAELGADADAAVLSSESVLVRFRPDLSYLPEVASAGP